MCIRARNAKIPVVEFRDMCKNNPCNNHGSCFMLDETVVCFCDNNYLGDRCEGMYNVYMYMYTSYSYYLLIVFLFCLSVRQSVRPPARPHVRPSDCLLIGRSFYQSVGSFNPYLRLYLLICVRARACVRACM